MVLCTRSLAGEHVSMCVRVCAGVHSAPEERHVMCGILNVGRLLQTCGRGWRSGPGQKMGGEVGL